MTNILRLSSLIFCSALLSACFSTRLGGSSAVRVGTYNIRTSTGDRGSPNAWASRKADLSDLVRRLDVDVMGLQEVRPDQAAFLTNALPAYALFGDHRAADRVSGEASPILYRKDRFEPLRGDTFWLSETPETPGSVSWNSAYPRVCTWIVLRDRLTGASFCLANTHTDHVSAQAREQGTRLILNRIGNFAQGLPVVLTGDHNCRETEAPALILAKNMNNALYASKTIPTGPWRTFNGWTYRANEPQTLAALTLTPGERNVGSGQPFFRQCGGSRIDYVYVSRDVVVCGYETDGSVRPGSQLYPSDHFPCVATVRFD